MNRVYLGLGSNVGDKVGNIKNTINEFVSNKKLYDFKSSSLYETKPYGEIDQDNFINCAVTFLTENNITELFYYVKELEKKIGRIKRKTWGPREIDIDILLFGDLVFENENISVPHKDLINRDFVIVPLLELNEELVHPANNKKLKIFLSELSDSYIILKKMKRNH